MYVCSLDKHPFPHIDKCNECKDKQGMCKECYARYMVLSDIKDAEIKACPECQEAQRKASADSQRNDTIVSNRHYGEHIALTCRNHPDLTWSTKNIGCIGMRSIFFNGGVECSCPMSDLIVKVAK